MESSILIMVFGCVLLLSTVFFYTNGQPQSTRLETNADIQSIIIDLGQSIAEDCPPMQCTGLDCTLVTERNGCQLCACPIGSPARGCDPMPFVLWSDLMLKGCPNVTNPEKRKRVQKVHRWFRRLNRFENTDECVQYVFPYCAELDFNLWRSPRTKEECEFYCYSFAEQKQLEGERQEAEARELRTT